MTRKHQVWAITDARGCVIERVNTCGNHPESNVMRCHAIDEDFADDVRFDRRVGVWVADTRIVAIKRRNAALAMVSDPMTATRIALGLISDEDKAAMIEVLTEAFNEEENHDANK